MNFEKRRRVRMLMDFIITLSVMLLIGWNCPLMVPVVFAYGLWNYYDGQTRRELRLGWRNNP
jgi:hypothetical protein